MTAAKTVEKMVAKIKLLNECNWHWHPGLRIYFCSVKPTLSKTLRNVKCIFNILPSCHSTGLHYLHLFAQICRRTILDTKLSRI